MLVWIKFILTNILYWIKVFLFWLCSFMMMNLDTDFLSFILLGWFTTLQWFQCWYHLSILRNLKPLSLEIFYLPILYVLFFWNFDYTTLSFSLYLMLFTSMLPISLCLGISFFIISSAMSSNSLIFSFAVSNLVLNVLIEFLIQKFAFSISRNSIFSYLLSYFHYLAPYSF